MKILTLFIHKKCKIDVQQLVFVMIILKQQQQKAIAVEVNVPY